MIKRIKFIISELNKLIKDKILIIKNNKKYKLKDLLSLPEMLINGQVLYRYVKTNEPRVYQKNKHTYFIRYKNYLDFLLHY
jgi:hypothetical protein